MSEVEFLPAWYAQRARRRTQWVLIAVATGLSLLTIGVGTVWLLS